MEGPFRSVPYQAAEEKQLPAERASAPPFFIEAIGGIDAIEGEIEAIER